MTVYIVSVNEDSHVVFSDLGRAKREFKMKQEHLADDMDCSLRRHREKPDSAVSFMTSPEGDTYWIKLIPAPFYEGAI